MSYIAANLNSAQAPLNQAQQLVLNTQGVTDPIAQQNFELLNKFLNDVVHGRRQTKCNLVIGPTYAWGSGITTSSTTSVVTPGQLQAQITTEGNPVKVKLAPFFQAGNPSQLVLTTSAANILSCIFGWQRINAQGVTTTICSVKAGLTVTPASGHQTTVSKTFQLPAFEIEDVVPTGVYTYQFFFQMPDSSHTLKAQNLNVVLRELR